MPEIVDDQTTNLTMFRLTNSLNEFGLSVREIEQVVGVSAHSDKAVRYPDLKRIVESGLISGADMAGLLGGMSGHRSDTDLLAKRITPVADRLSGSFLLEHKLFPYLESIDDEVRPDLQQDQASSNAESLILLVANPFDSFAIDAANKALRSQCRVVVAPIDEIEILLDRYVTQRSPVPGASQSAKSKDKNSLNLLLDLASGAPVVTVVNELLEQAVDLRATDIHLEPTREDLNVRYRIDGVLRKMPERSGELGEAVVSRIKILAGLDIAEKRKPQDGGARLTVHGNELDLRIATLPTNHGESVVLRLLARNNSLTDFAAMGMSDRDFRAVHRLLDQPYGMIAVTGPTGSGKTTTLATAINDLNDASRKIVTIEDPIEYQIDNVAQSQVRPEIGSTFATAIRAFVRQDPDVIMVGEIRDGETAKAAVQAAQTGHLLLTTLHANTAVAAIARLRDLGVESFLLASNLRGVIAQRLVRVLCNHCKKKHTLDKQMFLDEPRYSLFPFSVGEEVYRANGCSRCGETGYRGRMPVFEVFEITNDIALAIGEEAPALKLQELAVSNGMTTLSMDAKRLVEKGLTSPEEIFRVTAYL